MFSIDSYLQPHESFHFARKLLDAKPPRFAHYHDYYELFIVEKGAVNHWANGRDERLEAGTIACIRPADVHHVSAAADTGAQIINVMFRTDTADHLVRRYGADLENHFFWSTEPQPATYTLSGPRFERGVNLSLDLQTTRRSLARIERYLLAIMTGVVDLSEQSDPTLPGWLIQACAQARLPEVFREGAAGFVMAAGRGHEHVCRKTKEHLGVTPSAYINQIRMEYAAHMLRSEDITVSGVAELIGMENLSHFYRTFKNHYGITPRAYRHQHQKSPF
ncbi:AraC family cel operon transcriptional repressor [Rubricella aquisinus]|uniref:AraC family cel operon transcriptional repressor n=1 Tax=Rubricella aquisinus TaxID=2028108 RepID=A0A840WG83_9RHOB|nr:AraC family transcriptional regulator [Rubricella aquisinus]MBB5514159.1 AraC family cel operon transcriptional repressor [Rubricella aquisinus]